MTFKFPWISRKAAQAEATRSIAEVDRALHVQLTAANNELVAMRHDERNQAQELYRLNERLSASAALCADKQREIAMLRSQLQEKEALHTAERAEMREENKRLMDWVAKGMTGVPIFVEPPKDTPEPAEAPTKPVTERVPTDVEEAISKVGRRARSVVNHITHKKDADFLAAMQGAGVKRIFADDKVDAEVEAQVIHERQTTSA
jgi:hypothetical protein